MPDLVPRPTSGQLQCYLADDGNVYAVNPSDGSAYQIGTGTNAPRIPPWDVMSKSVYCIGAGAANAALIDHAAVADTVTNPSAALPNFASISYDVTLEIDGREAIGFQKFFTIPPERLPSHPFNFLVTNCYFYNKSLGTPSGNWEFYLQADLGAGLVWNQISDSGGADLKDYFTPSSPHQLILVPVIHNDPYQTWFTGDQPLNFALQCGYPPGNGADSSMRAGILLQPFYY